MENRTRFVLAVIKEIKKRVGQDFPVQVFMNGVEAGVGELGLSVEENQALARLYEPAGVDSLHVKSHWVGMHQGSYLSDVLFYPEPHIPLSEFPKEMDWSRKGALCNVPLAAAIKEVVSIPVMTVCGFDADSAEKTLREGKADLIGFNRRIFADPEYPTRFSQEGSKTHPAVYSLRQLQQHLQRGEEVPHQRLLRHGQLRSRAARGEEAGAGGRRRAGRHAGGQGGGATGS